MLLIFLWFLAEVVKESSFSFIVGFWLLFAQFGLLLPQFRFRMWFWFLLLRFLLLLFRLFYSRLLENLFIQGFHICFQFSFFHRTDNAGMRSFIKFNLYRTAIPEASHLTHSNLRFLFLFKIINHI